MKGKAKLSLAAAIWLTTTLGAFFYGYTRAIETAIPETQSFSLQERSPTSRQEPPTDPGLDLSETEIAAIKHARENGGDAALEEFMEGGGRGPAREGPFDDDTPALSSEEALSIFLENFEARGRNPGEIFRAIRLLEGEDISTAVLAIWESESNDRRMRGMAERLIQKLAREDPAAAISLANTIPANSERVDALGSVLNEWARQDPYAVLDWLGENPTLDMATMDRTAYTLFNQIAIDDMGTALEMLNGVEDSETRRRAATGVMNQLINSGANESDSLSNFIASQPISIQENLISAALRNNQFRGFDNAVTLAQSFEDSNPQLAQEAYEIAAARNARDFPEQTATWALTLNNPDTQREVLEEVMEEWTRYDLDGAGEWLSDAPRSPIYDAAYSHYAQEAAKSDPANAITWAEAISDSSDRDTTVSSIAKIWASQDSNAAITYIQATQHISSEARQELLDQLRQ